MLCAVHKLDPKNNLTRTGATSSGTHFQTDFGEQIPDDAVYADGSDPERVQ